MATRNIKTLTVCGKERLPLGVGSLALPVASLRRGHTEPGNSQSAFPAGAVFQSTAGEEEVRSATEESRGRRVRGTGMATA